MIEVIIIGLILIAIFSSIFYSKGWDKATKLSNEARAFECEEAYHIGYKNGKFSAQQVCLTVNRPVEKTATKKKVVSKKKK